MKKLVFLLAFFPAIAVAQERFYYSADAGLNFGKFLEYTGYGILASANAKIAPRIYAGLSTGAVQVKPFIKNPAFPLAGRLTFFTSVNEERLAPFGLFEVGKLFYNEEAFGGSSQQTMKGELYFFTGVGVKLVSERRTHVFFALGYSGFNFSNHISTGPNTAYTNSYHYQRIAVRAGLMLPH